MSGVPTPFSLRLTFEERARLERDAAGMALGAYIRSQVLDEDVAPRKVRNKFPVKDHKLLAEALALLGQARIANNLNQLARQANTGSLSMDTDSNSELRATCAVVRRACNLIISSMGHEP
jgi:Bacterial mobilisation protein (MobC)